MKQEQRDHLQNLKDNPPTGDAHGHHLIKNQVDTLFLLDTMNQDFESLKETIIKMDQQNDAVERKVLYLTIVTTVLTVLQIILLFMTQKLL
jgi:hypothetical protein